MLKYKLEIGDYMAKNIFDFIKPLSNDKLTSMDGKTLQKLINYINKYMLEYREELLVPENITFGTEFEYEKTDYKTIKKYLSKYDLKSEWQSKIDTSIKNGGEVSSPILTNTKETWKNIKKVGDILKEKAVNGPLCSAHVHIGSNILTNNINEWLNFIYLWSAYEHIIFRFAYGEYLNNREKISEFAKPVRTFYQKKHDIAIEEKIYLEELVNELKIRRDLAVNMKNVELNNIQAEKNTIEFRCPNGTFNEIIWQNNINLFIHLLLYSKSSLYDYETIKKQNEEMKTFPNQVEYYNGIYLKPAFDLCDMIFNNNIDKIYFLRQYLKNYGTCYGNLKQAKTFTKEK